MAVKKVEFPNLNGLRFLAAYGVVITHIEQAKSIFGLPNIFGLSGIAGLGTKCVWLFFVLSGFLITYLLMEESRIFGTVDVFRFYVRRVLRIWPLYFVICLLGFGILPHLSFFDVPSYPPVLAPGWWKSLALYIAFSAHVAETWLPPVVYAGVLWSIGIEEWFYAAWPWLIKLAKRWQLHILLAIILLLNVARFVVPAGHFRTFLYTMRFECMAVGGLFAMLLHAKGSALSRTLLPLIFSRAAQAACYAFLAAALIGGWTLWPFDANAYALLFGVLVLNLAANPDSLINLETRLLHHLGDLSYGVYCYNWITAVIAVKLAGALLAGHSAAAAGAAAYLIGTALVLGTAELSYRIIEYPCLSLKRRAFTLLPNMDQPAQGKVS